jgi:hypothetical protein
LTGIKGHFLSKCGSIILVSGAISNRRFARFDGDLPSVGGEEEESLMVYDQTGHVLAGHWNKTDSFERVVVRKKGGVGYQTKRSDCRPHIEVWKEVTTLLRYEKFGWKCANNLKGQEEPSPITG